MKEWISIKEMFYNICDENYLILRNIDELYDLEKIDDIDILCDNKTRILQKINALPVGKRDNGFNYYVLISGKKVFVDIREIGDDYYCEKWEKNMLFNRKKHDFFFVLSEIDFAYSYYYHILLHKVKIDSTRLNNAIRLFATAGLGELTEGKLINFLVDNLYSMPIPKDKNVNFNFCKYKMMMKKYLDLTS